MGQRFTPNFSQCNEEEAFLTFHMSSLLKNAFIANPLCHTVTWTENNKRNCKTLDGLENML